MRDSQVQRVAVCSCLTAILFAQPNPWYLNVLNFYGYDILCQLFISEKNSHGRRIIFFQTFFVSEAYFNHSYCNKKDVWKYAYYFEGVQFFSSLYTRSNATKQKVKSLQFSNIRLISYGLKGLWYEAKLITITITITIIIIIIIAIFSITDKWGVVYYVFLKTNRCSVFRCNNDRLFLEKYYIKVLFLPEKRA